MKYQNWDAFEKHLRGAVPDNLSSVYLIVAGCSYERKKIFASIVSAIQKKDPSVVPSLWDGASVDIHALLSQLNTLSLFGERSVMILEGSDKLKKNALEALAAYVAHPSSSSYLLLGASSSKSLATLVQQGEKECVVLDMSEEKPWDKKSRLQRHLAHFAQAEGKSLNSDAAAYLLEHVGLDLAALEQEMNKALSFVGEAQRISLNDVRQLCVTDPSAQMWQLAEAIIWAESSLPRIQPIDLAGLFPLIAQLRSQLQLGLQIGSLLEQGVAEIASHVPKVRGQILDKRIAFCRARTSRYFQAGLHHLFEMELLAKNSSYAPPLLLDLFTFKLKAYATCTALTAQCFE